MALLPWFLPVTVRAREDIQWQPRKIEGREYVTAEQIAQFYGLELSPRDGKTVVIDDKKKVKISLEIGSPECVINNLKFIFTTPVREADSSALVSRSDLSRVLDPVLRPKMIINNVGLLETVILDPAHGGDDRGAASELGNAADYTLEIAKIAAKELERTGNKVVLTRDDDVAVTPEKRLELANAVKGGAVFIRIHFGENEKPGIGTSPLSLMKDKPADDALVQGEFGPASMALATAVQASVSTTLRSHMEDLGIQPSDDPVFSQLKHPAIFLDVGCLGDPQDARLIHNEAYRRNLAMSISLGIKRYKKATGQ